MSTGSNDVKCEYKMRERERDTETERYRDRKRETYKQTDRDFTTPPINYFFKIGKYFTI